MSGLSPENWIDIPGVGALLGMAVGDALGTTYEFQGIEQPDYPTLATGPATDLVGRGPFDLKAGQVTDDTQMAVCLARSLADKRGIDMVDLATRYVAWFQHAFDVGNQTAGALRAIEQGESVGTAARRVWHGSGRRAAGNGSLMRTVPIGVFYARTSVEKLVEASVSDSIITHADPRCVIACAAFNAAIARGVVMTGPGTRMASGSGASLPVNDGVAVTQAQFEAGRVAIPIAAAKLRELYDDNRDDLALIDAAVEDLERDLEVCASDNPRVYRVDLDLRKMAGFVRVAFRLAFWHLMHTPSWRAAVVDVASRGGDADTNAAIVGALLGARDGVAAIPREWIDRVLGVKQPGPDDWAESIHPKHLLAFARVAAE
ncbi:MAG TPA: ADP-ribosylglycohydrolase family protein [Kofleriaceae bacterium]